MYQLFESYHVFLALAGVCLGAIAMGIVGWKMFPFQKKSMESLVSSYEAHLRDYEKRYQEIKNERDNYQSDLRNVRGLQEKSLTRISELEGRPDIGTIKTLLEAQRLALTGLGDSITTSIAALITDNVKTFTAIQNTLQSMETALERVFGEMHEQVNHFDKRHTELLDKLIKVKSIKYGQRKN